VSAPAMEYKLADSIGTGVCKYILWPRQLVCCIT